jgi:glycosyltransferase involved in cell wall biosynthesis
MLCGCIPVVSAVAAMPDIVGQEGYILQSKNVLELKSILERIPNEYSVEKMEAVRNRIESLYTEEARAKKLLDTIAKV